MKDKPSALHKWLSYSRWQRRFGAKQLVSDPRSLDYEKMKRECINLGEPVLTRGSAKDLKLHHDNLRQEFSGQSELSFYHAFLIVLIRREYDLEKSIEKFVTLWEAEYEWLLKNINLRWLMSANDTFIDHSKDQTDASLALATSFLVNTVKIYETENIMTRHTNIVYDRNIVSEVQKQNIPLFEGMTCFTVGTDDTLRNMVWRIKENKQNTIAARILIEVIERLSRLPTAYGRLRENHIREKTKWWAED